jgi:hypothetical protein
MVNCKTCNGTGHLSLVHVHREDGNHHWVEGMTCWDCKGHGVWSDERVAGWERGRTHRDHRIARDLSLMEAAKLMGIKTSELSDYEHGRADLPDGIAPLTALALDALSQEGREK